MNADEKFELIKRNTVEIIGEDDLKEMLSDETNKREKIAYIGFEPSGKIHMGHYLQIRKMMDLHKAGFKVVILLADFHAYLNQKGTLEDIGKLGEYNKSVFEAMGLEAEYIYGSEYQLGAKYTEDVYKLALRTTLKRARRSMEVIAREDDNPKVAEVVYPLMQANDIKHLNVAVAVGGMEQRKIHVLARELLPNMDFESPICLHNPVLSGLDGVGKMSSSKGNLIAADDEDKDIKKKIKEAYCPMKEVDGNPILEIAHYYLEYPAELKRPEKYGGNVVFESYEDLEKAYVEGLHPMDLKNMVAESMIKIITPIREKMKGMNI
ncbi:tyrosine--tRNA ligase [Methanococcus voltae]|uniref:Tyrosine--tRNA ligase n=1 Tax=Methanococcus voltae (strain ATCC BAA-1334 / A3) TaxID=456320 RepID=D7DR80_METV3|nr:tyrosine--tRNA ligase [Methanococcus voltae]MCS3901017.1 tyrosyl-tRNA synthetase [Methanococcus voltae]